MTRNASAARNNEAQGLGKQLSISNKATAKWGRGRRGNFPRVILHALQKFSPNSHWLVLSRSRLLSLRLLLIVCLWKKFDNTRGFRCYGFTFNKFKTTLRHSGIFNRLKFCPVPSERSLGSFPYISGQKLFLSLKPILLTRTLTCLFLSGNEVDVFFERWV